MCAAHILGAMVNFSFSDANAVVRLCSTTTAVDVCNALLYWSSCSDDCAEALPELTVVTFELTTVTPLPSIQRERVKALILSRLSAIASDVIATVTYTVEQVVPRSVSSLTTVRTIIQGTSASNVSRAASGLQSALTTNSSFITSMSNASGGATPSHVEVDDSTTKSSSSNKDLYALLVILIIIPILIIIIVVVCITSRKKHSQSRSQNYPTDVESAQKIQLTSPRL
jgi:hypothetical protein